MSNDSPEEAVDVLQELGLKEYEARCFVGLTRLSQGTAKQLSDITAVPRTRIYDAIRVLEAKGLVEVQHSSPQRFRAVSLPEATATLRDQYEARVERLANALERTDRVDPESSEPVQEVWSMSGTGAIENRVLQLLDEATDEVVLVIGDETLLTPGLVAGLNELPTSVDLFVGAVTESLRENIEEAAPRAKTFVSGLDWLRGEETVADGEVAIARLLLADRANLLVSTISPGTDKESAVFGSGFRNGLVTISRRLMAQGLVPGALAD